MSSLRNTVNRRTHRERAQPLERKRLGLLEKHKDYQKRASDYKAKQKTLKSLREKAADRNDDEFYFGMMSRAGPGSALTRKNTFTGAVEGDRGNRAMDVDVVRLLKTQDLGYLRTVRNVARREREGLEERWDEEGEGGGKVKKIVFCEGEGERVGVVGGEEEKEEEEDNDKGKEEEKKAKNLERLRTKLLNARKKVKALAEAEYQLELQQAKMAKTATSGGYTKGGHKIKVRERKR
ncbi:small-subunit processome [Schizothecium vesticola]|uniref:U3 small nucleolar RNA-associated protein 11 n=1 Tax=Schizothecium vesticola TaxID=314040 RepID=A0AA40F9Z6_9PEZI|nr:small-subunit processome [Schizothecium vesticola]